MIRAVLDTNVLVRAFLKRRGALSPILEAFEMGLYVLVISKPILLELRETLGKRRIKMKHQLTDEAIETYALLILSFGQLVEPEQALSVCRDPDDNRIIEAAVAGQAMYVVTGDKDLLVLESYEGIRFLRPVEFLRRLDEEQDKSE